MSAVVTPERSLEQRRAALVHANDVRAARSRLKRDLKAGRRRLADVLANPSAEVEGMKVYDLLLAAPGLGRVKVQNRLAFCRISPSRTVSALSERQRRELLTALRRPGLRLTGSAEAGVSR